MATEKKPPAQTVAVRLDAQIVDRLDALAARLTRPGLDLNRSDAARVALVTGLDALDREEAAKSR